MMMNYVASLARPRLKAVSLMLLFVLAGCTGTHSTVDSDVALEAGNDEAIVVLSLRANSPRASAISATWRKFDPAINFFADTSTDNSSSSSEAPTVIDVGRYGTVIAGTGPMESVKYLVFKVQPGVYALDSYRLTDFQLKTQTTLRLRPNTLIFSVKDGEILYIGNFLIDVPKAKDKILGITEYYLNKLMRIRYEGEDKAAVEALLATNYRALTGPVSFRKPKRTKLELPN